MSFFNDIKNNLKVARQGSDLTYGIDERGKMYVHNGTLNKMIWYGDRKGGMDLIKTMAANGDANSYKFEGDKSTRGDDPQAPASPTSTGNHYVGGSSYNAAAAEEARQKAFYQALLDSLPGKKEIDRGMIDRKYNDSFSALTSQRDNAFSNLDSEQRKLDKQRARAYGQIQNDSQNLLQGLNTQLGMYGAGNSSATQMGAIAAADVANKQSAEITDDYNDQLSNISSSRANIKKEYEDENNKLNTWKNEQYLNLDKSYQDLENNYRGKIGGAANLDAVVQTFRDMKAPEAKVNKLPEYKADGLAQVDLSGQVQAPTMTSQQAQKYFTGTTTANTKRKEEDKKENLVA